MNNAYLEKAKKQISDPKILAVLAAKRTKQLVRGARPLVRIINEENYLNIALLEIAEKKISYDPADEDSFD